MALTPRQPYVDTPSTSGVDVNDPNNAPQTNEEEGETFADAYQFFLENLGMPRQYDHELLGGLVDEHSAHWVIEAMKIAVKRNARNLAYVEKILTRWKSEGYGTPYPRRNGSKPNTNELIDKVLGVTDGNS